MLKFNLDKRLRSGNTCNLALDGEGFFPRLNALIRSAKKEVLLETFILADDEVGQALKSSLVEAANKNVRIVFTVDGWGSYYLPAEFVNELVEAGVVIQIYDPQPKWLNARPKLVHRLHRKIAVIDGETAFVGGINFSDDHLTHGNPHGKRDYVAEVQGPIVEDIRSLCLNNLDSMQANLLRSTETPQNSTMGSIDMAFVSRDNRRSKTDIEKAYIEKINQAKNRILIANAYIFPSYRLVKALRKAAKRGVDVKMLTQGKPDLPYTLAATHSIYKKLIYDGVKLFEYVERPLHGKIAAFDDNWATIGSSNLDPWSLGSNLESNLFIRDEKINTEITGFIEDLILNSRQLNMEWVRRRPILGFFRDTALYHLMRWWPKLIKIIPNEQPNIETLDRSANDEIENGKQGSRLHSSA